MRNMLAVNKREKSIPATAAARGVLKPQRIESASEFTYSLPSD
jgi:hypothetical protein